ncbi:uncharacterized protein LOC123384431 [Felis catus]|uniref:uncharacterized protein LOC123384431 n=1 Tax=Felis catus TaxID=9685 RepID=UPI001D19E444|nr:uncharacterized protein LOC123384431 [Felis catus]XP_044910041.1 uncharacterized protein LOC123384431 [Felis catus]
MRSRSATSPECQNSDCIGIWCLSLHGKTQAGKARCLVLLSLGVKQRRGGLPEHGRTCLWPCCPTTSVLPWRRSERKEGSRVSLCSRRLPENHLHDHPLCALQDPPGPSFSHLRLGRWLSHVLQACTGRANDWNLKESLCFHPGSHLQNILEFYSMMLPCTPLAGLVCGHPQSVFQGYELTGVLLPFRICFNEPSNEDENTTLAF